MKTVYLVKPIGGLQMSLTAGQLSTLLEDHKGEHFEVETSILPVRLWCAVYCAEEYSEEVEKVLRVMYQAIGTVHPEWEFDIDQDWERCHDELEQ